MAETRESGLDDPGGAFLGTPPPFFSLAYHCHFLPRVIAWRLSEPRREPAGFRHVQLEIPIVIGACVLLMLFGAQGSPFGWVCAAIGAAGLVALIGWSIVGESRWRRETGHRYGYAEFVLSVFFFCVLAGLSAGLIAGGVITNDPVMGYLWAPPGLVLGYLVAPFAARWIHGLGFIKVWFIYLAVLGLVLLPLEDLMVLFIYASKAR